MYFRKECDCSILIFVYTLFEMNHVYYRRYSERQAITRFSFQIKMCPIEIKLHNIKKPKN